MDKLTSQCQLKINECYEAWMSLTAADEQLENVQIELDDWNGVVTRADGRLALGKLGALMSSLNT